MLIAEVSLFLLQIPHRIVQIRVLAGVIILLHDHYTLTGPLSTQVDKSQLGNLKGVALQWNRVLFSPGEDHLAKCRVFITFDTAPATTTFH